MFLIIQSQTPHRHIQTTEKAYCLIIASLLFHELVRYNKNNFANINHRKKHCTHLLLEDKFMAYMYTYSPLGGAIYQKLTSGHKRSKGKKKTRLSNAMLTIKCCPLQDMQGTMKGKLWKSKPCSHSHLKVPSCRTFFLQKAMPYYEKTTNVSEPVVKNLSRASVLKCLKMRPTIIECYSQFVLYAVGQNTPVL